MKEEKKVYEVMMEILPPPALVFRWKMAEIVRDDLLLTIAQGATALRHGSIDSAVDQMVKYVRPELEGDYKIHLLHGFEDPDPSDFSLVMDLDRRGLPLYSKRQFETLCDMFYERVPEEMVSRTEGYK